MKLSLSLISATLLACLALGACDRFAKSDADETSIFMLYNFAGEPVTAATVEDNAGGQGNLEVLIPDGFISGMGTPGNPDEVVNEPYSLVLQWTQGSGRMRWREARLPIQIEQPRGRHVEIYLRPDGFVCASLIDDQHVPQGDEAPWARVHQDRATLSCAEPIVLPEPKPGAAKFFTLDSTTHSWKRHEGSGNKSVTYRQLFHNTGQVKFRFGDAFRGGPWYLDEFYSIRVIGDQAALLVDAPLRPAVHGMYLVTGDERGWSSRFLGQTGDSEQWLTDTTVVIGQRVLVDVASGALYRLPSPIDELQVLGQRNDGSHLALHFKTSTYRIREGYPNVSEIVVWRLEDGALATVVHSDTLLSAKVADPWKFARDWYGEHCSWSDDDAWPLRCN